MSFVLCVLVGCDDGARTGPAPREASTPAPVFTARPPSAGVVIGGETVRRVVDAPRSAPERPAPTPELREAIEATPLPVLMPADAEDAQLHVGDGWYALTRHRPGYSLNLQASARAKLYPDIASRRGDWDVRGTHGTVSNNEGIWSVDWVEHGVAYSLELE